MIAITVLIMVIVISLGYGAQNLSDQLKELKATVAEQGEKIEQFDSEISELYGKIGAERPQPAEEAE